MTQCGGARSTMIRAHCPATCGTCATQQRPEPSHTTSGGNSDGALVGALVGSLATLVAVALLGGGVVAAWRWRRWRRTTNLRVRRSSIPIITTNPTRVRVEMTDSAVSSTSAGGFQGVCDEEPPSGAELVSQPGVQTVEDGDAEMVEPKV